MLTWRYSPSADNLDAIRKCLNRHFHLGYSSIMWLTVMSHSSLRLIMGKPLVGQLTACSAPNGLPHILCEARSFGSHPYLRHRASRNALLYRVIPWSCMGRMVSQVEAPFHKRDPGTVTNVMVAVTEECLQHLAGSPYRCSQSLSWH